MPSTPAIREWRDAEERDGFFVYVSDFEPNGPDDDLVALIGVEAPAWTVTAQIRRRPHGLGLAALSVTPVDDQADVTSKMLRSLPLGRILAQARKALAAEADLPHFGPIDENPDDPKVKAAYDDRMRRAKALATEVQATPAKGPGRTGYGDEFYRGVALAYLELLDQGYGRGQLNRRLAERYGVDLPTMRTWVHRSRELEFMTPGTPGLIGGAPGRRLKG